MTHPAPFLNDYTKAYQYQTYDVTPLLGENNRLEILLGKGWYMGTFGLAGGKNLFGKPHDGDCGAASYLRGWERGSHCDGRKLEVPGKRHRGERHL